LEKESAQKMRGLIDGGVIRNEFRREIAFSLDLFKEV
jgi:hypothetical protein